MEFELFLSRFHPLIVHLPIGFLLLAAIMELLLFFSKKKYQQLQLAISISFLLGGIAAIAAAITGYFLSQSGGYDDQTLFWHKWLGISLIVVSFAGWFIKTKKIKKVEKLYPVIAISLIILLSITGHLGGNLTHGSEYLLVHAPKFVQKMAGMEVDGANKNAKIPSKTDSIKVYDHLVKPFLAKKCFSCHSETKANGDLILSTIEGINAGGDSGPAIVPEQIYKSEVFVRSTLPKGSKKFMPPKGNPLTYSEIKILEWWINMGASFDATIDSYEVPKEIELLLLRDYGVDTKPKPYYDLVEVPLVPDDVKDTFLEEGIKASTLSNGHHLLDVSITASEISQSQAKLLLKAKEQITWLDLSRKMVNDEILADVGELTNLTRLNLKNNPITDSGVSHLKNLTHLEVLNLYGTAVTDSSLNTIKELVALKKLYLWQTQVTKEGIDELKKQLPDLKVVTGVM